MTAIAWIGRAFREKDNTALRKAAEDHEEVLPVFVDDIERSNEEPGYPKLKFRKEAMEEFRDKLRDQENDLVVRRGDPVDELAELVEEVGADAVYHNKGYTPYRVDLRGRAEEELGVPVNSFKDKALFEEKEILTNSGTPYKVYSYFKKKWFKKEKRKPEETPGFDSPEVEPGDIPGPKDYGLEKPDGMEVWPGGREEALERLESFVEDHISDYDEKRDLAAKSATSRLSPHLKYGTVSVREAFWKAERQRVRGASDEGVDVWQEELAWRDYYFQILFNFPHSLDEPFMDKYRGNEPEWEPKEEAPEKWRRWVEGKTGYPFVDAGMRQLRETGWMHNRLRMVVTNFSCKDLWLDWRDVHEYFNRMFVDAEVSAMVGGIQWSYSIGTDAQPYFRVFNPVTQGERYDEGGQYIRRWVPELEDVPDEYVHEPWRMSKTEQQQVGCVIGGDYPERIVDHDERRKKAVDRFEQLEN